MKNILIINQSHTTNVGDKAIGIALERWVSNHGWNPIILPFWEERAVFGPLSYTKISAVLKTVSVTADFIVGNWVRNILKNVLKCQKIDYAILGGGELFSSHRGFNAVFSCWINELVKRGIPCCVIGISGDDTLSKAQIKRNKNALQRCSLIGVRDEFSKIVFDQLYGINTTSVPDAVFMLGNETIETRNRLKQGIVCVPIQGYRDIKGDTLNNELDYYHDIVESNRLVDEHVVFTTTEQRDEFFVRDLCSRINKKYSTDYGYIPYGELDTFFKLISTTRVVISGRMHAMIIGLICGSSIKPIPIGKKLMKFNEEYANCDNISAVIAQTIDGYEEYAEIISNL